jgi:biofilm PGA synthesis lipoprotein PgaB
VRFQGIVFQDDATLNDFEDYSPAGRKAQRALFGRDVPADFSKLTKSQQNAWTTLKTQTLIAFTKELAKEVNKHRPYATFARTLYAPTLTQPFSEEWLAQSYAASLSAYDNVIVMAYPELEGIWLEQAWLRKLVAAAGKYPDGLDKTIFKVQTYDWKGQKWISDKKTVSRIRTLAAARPKMVKQQ